MALEEKKEKRAPKALQPEAATLKLQAKLKESLKQTSKAGGAKSLDTGLAASTRRLRMKSVPMNSTADAALDGDNGFKLTTTRLVRPTDTVKLNDTM